MFDARTFVPTRRSRPPRFDPADRMPFNTVVSELDVSIRAALVVSKRQTGDGGGL